MVISKALLFKIPNHVTLKNVQQEEIEELVAVSKRGDSSAFGKLYDLFVNQIYRYVYYRVGKEEAEDLTELVFLKTWENIRQYKSGKRSFSSWIFRIAHNVVVDYYRSNNYQAELHENIKDERLEMQTMERAHRHFDQSLLNEAMRGLKDHYRQIIILKYINELSYEEIGYIMGKSQASLRILQFRALKSLRNILESSGISQEDV